MGFWCCLLNKSPKRVDKARPAYWVHKNYIALPAWLPGAIPNLGPCFDHHHNECKNKGWLSRLARALSFSSFSFPGCFLASSGWIRGPPATAEPLARPRPQKKTNHRNHQPHHSTHQPRPAALGGEPSHPDRLIRSPTDQKDRLSTRTHLFRPPRRAAGCACRAARLGCGSGSCTRNRAGCGPVVGSWLGFAP